MSTAGREAFKEELKAYRQERESMLAPKPVIYEPIAAVAIAAAAAAAAASTGSEESKNANLLELSAATPVISSVRGMKEILKEETERAEWFASGRPWIEHKRAWQSERQEREISALIQHFQTEAAQNGREGEGLLSTLFSGGYVAPPPPPPSSSPPDTRKSGGGGGAAAVGGKEDPFTQIRRLTLQNESYHASDEQGLLGKVRTLVAATPTPTAAPAPAPKAKAKLASASASASASTSASSKATAGGGSKKSGKRAVQVS